MPTSVKTETIQRDLPPLEIRAAVRPDSVNREARTVDVVFSTGARVKRFGWDGDYYEELSLEPSAVRLDFLNRGAPFLAMHNSYSLDAVVGVVESARIENGQGVATIRFASDEISEGVFRKVDAGILRFVSVGYVCHRMEMIEDSSDGVPVYRVMDWEPLEISAVSIPADKGAEYRSYGLHSQTCSIIRREGQTMSGSKTGAAGDDANKGAGAQAPAGGPTAADVEAARNEGARLERERATGIRGLVSEAKLDTRFAEEMIAQGVTVEAARQRIEDLGKWGEKNKGLAPNGTNRPETDIRAGDLDARITMRSAMEAAILNRFDPQRYTLAGDHPGREYRAMSLFDIARESVEALGLKTRGMSRMEIAAYALNLRGFHSSSDFPLITANVLGKTLRDAYDTAPRTFVPLGRRATLPDYKEVSRVQFGDAPELKRVLPGDEYTYGTIGEGAEKYKLFKYGRIFAVTREMIINDDLDALARVPMLFGRSAADLESDLFWNVVIANAALADGFDLFSTEHANIDATGAVISVASLGAGRAAMRKQKSVDGKQRINVAAKFLVVPAALETKADQFVSTALLANQANAVNTFAGRLTVVPEPRLDDASEEAWYLWADPGQIDTIEYAYMQGEEGVQVEMQEGFDIDGTKIKARLDFGVKAIDFRGVYKNAGAAEPTD